MVLTLTTICLGIAVALTLLRVLLGPTWADRLIAADFLGSTLAVLFVTVALKTGFGPLLDAALLMSLLSFLSSVALASYMLNARVMK